MSDLGDELVVTDGVLVLNDLDNELVAKIGVVFSGPYNELVVKVGVVFSDLGDELIVKDGVLVLNYLDNKLVVKVRVVLSDLDDLVVKVGVLYVVSWSVDCRPPFLSHEDDGRRGGDRGATLLLGVLLTHLTTAKYIVKKYYIHWNSVKNSY